MQEDLKEYCTACNDMEAEIASLLAASSDQTAEGERAVSCLSKYLRYLPVFEMYVKLHRSNISIQIPQDSDKLVVPNLNIIELSAKVQEKTGGKIDKNLDTFHAQEEFWREMGQSSDRYDTISRFFGKLSLS